MRTEDKGDYCVIKGLKEVQIRKRGRGKVDSIIRKRVGKEVTCEGL